MSSRKNRTRYTGFTLMEMILVMILSGIVVSLVYLVLSNTSKEWQVFYTNRNKTASIVLFKQALTHDLDNAAYIYADSTDSYGFASGNDTLFYHLDKFIIRTHAGYPDTFFVSVKNVEHDYVDMLEPMHIVTAIKLDIYQPIGIKNIVIRKEYTSVALMQLYTQKITDSLWTYGD